MMQKTQLRKGLVLGIILLFIGTSVVPSFYGKNIQVYPSSLDSYGRRYKRNETKSGRKIK